MIVSLLWVAFILLVILAWVRVRSRLETGSKGRRTRLDDEAVRRIVREGRLEMDDEEPLDLDRIDEEERQFWEEGWDEPEEW